MQFNVYRVISKGDRTRAYPTAIAPGHFCLAGLRGSGTSFGVLRRREKTREETLEWASGGAYNRVAEC
jgi:hypothetical protein